MSDRGSTVDVLDVSTTSDYIKLNMADIAIGTKVTITIPAIVIEAS